VIARDEVVTSNYKPSFGRIFWLFFLTQSDFGHSGHGALNSALVSDIPKTRLVARIAANAPRVSPKFKTD